MPKLSAFDECGHATFGEFGHCLYRHTACGPWVVAVLMDGKKIYYGDDEARKLPMDTEVRCLQVGSIVEGSDASVGPYDVTDPKEFDATVERVNDECRDLWDEANEPQG